MPLPPIIGQLHKDCGHPVSVQIDIVDGICRLIFVAQCDRCSANSAAMLRSIRRFQTEVSRPYLTRGIIIAAAPN